MEFNEKLQQLRKQKKMTQEQLADKLFVSRTAVSKWESGKGYPNIESLKSLAKLFDVSIDELLSGEELLELASDENRSNMKKLYVMIYGIIDLMAVVFVFLPFYGQPEGGVIQAVNLLDYQDLSIVSRIMYYGVFSALIIFGAFELLARYQDDEKKQDILQKGSLALHSFAILLFSLTRQPYVTSFLFLLFIIKVFIKLKSRRIK